MSLVVLVGTIVLAGAALFAVLVQAPAPLAEVASLGLLWFLPGYSLQNAMLAAHTRLTWLERFGLSGGLSLALTAITGVLLDLAGVPITGYALAGTAAAVTLLGCILSLMRRPTEPDAARSTGWRSLFRPNPYHVTALAIFIAVGGGLSALAWKDPPASDQFTEIGIVSVDGDVPSVPLEVSAGETQRFSIVIANHEGEQATYNLRVETEDGSPVPPSQALVLSDGQAVAVPLEVVWSVPGRTRLIVELDLGPSTAYRELSLPVRVRE